MNENRQVENETGMPSYVPVVANIVFSVCALIGLVTYGIVGLIVGAIIGYFMRINVAMMAGSLTTLLSKKGDK